MSNRKVCFVTGASKDLSLTLVKRLLNKGYRVAATSRTANAMRSDVVTLQILPTGYH